MEVGDAASNNIGASAVASRPSLVVVSPRLEESDPDTAIIGKRERQAIEGSGEVAKSAMNMRGTYTPMPVEACCCFMDWAVSR